MKIAPALAIFAASFQQSLAGSNLISERNVQFKVHFPDTAQRSCDAVLFSVGTGASVEGYDTFAEAIMSKGFIVAIVDPERGSMTKLDVPKLKAAYLQARNNIHAWSSRACGSINKFIVGGHSAGGGTAHKIFSEDTSIADAIFSVDPFTRGDMGSVVPLPGLYWGFDVTTCFVNKELGAAGYYDLTATANRIFYRAPRVMELGLCGLAPRYYHCSIVDGGCTACTNCKDTPAYFFEDIANSVDAFAKSISGNWNPAVSCTTAVNIFQGRQSWQ